jgi:transcriptional regulator with XRE-family HTH domain
MFGEKLKQVRKEKGLTQKELSEQSEIPLPTIRSYEQGQSKPSWESVVALATALGVSTEAFREDK